MLVNVVLPWIHYVGVLLLTGAVFGKLYLMKTTPSADVVRTLVRIDRLEALSAVIVFGTGLARVWHGGKGAEYYWSNGLFHGVVGLFVLAALVSVIPTVRFLRWNRALDSGALPDAAAFRKTRIFSHLMLTAIVVITLLITLVAKGYGSHAGNA